MIITLSRHLVHCFATEYHHEKDERLEHLRRQVHGRRVREVVHDEAEHGGGAEEAVDGVVQPVAGAALLARANLSVQRAQVEQDARLLESHRALGTRHARQRVEPDVNIRKTLKPPAQLSRVHYNVNCQHWLLKL